MQEHFNENYMDSDKYPKATFKGKILDYSKDKLMSGEKYSPKVEGVLVIRGIEKELIADADLQMKKKQIEGTSKFIAKPADFEIKIPAVVRENIAKEIEVTVKTRFEPYSK